MLAESYWQLNHSLAHWIFEGQLMVLELIIGWPIAKWKVKHHDRKHHAGNHS